MDLCRSVFTFWHFYFKEIFGNIRNDIIFAFKFEVMKQYTVIEIALLATAFDKSTQTIERWIKSNDDRLTSDKAKLALLKVKK